MYYVYVLKHPTEDRIYIGFSTDLRSRMKIHRTEHREWRLAYYEAMLLKRMPERENDD